MKLYFIRHGLTAHNKRGLTNGQTIDEPLIEKGVKQAEELAEILTKSIKHIYSSDLLRAKQTAEIINKRLNANLTLHQELREIDLGSLTGKSWEEINDLTGRDLKSAYLAHDYNLEPWGGESVQAVNARVKKVIDEIKKDGKRALVVAHGGIVRAAYHILTAKNLKAGGVGNARIHVFEV